MSRYWIVQYQGGTTEGYFNIYVNEDRDEWSIARDHVDVLITIGKVPRDCTVTSLHYVREG